MKSNCLYLLNCVQQCVAKRIVATTLWQRRVGMASESCLHKHWQRSEPIRRRGRVPDGARSADGVQQIPESRSHASSDEAQHSPLQGNSCSSCKPTIPLSQSSVSKQQPWSEINFLYTCTACIPLLCFLRRTSMACTPVSCCSSETRSPCCCCCLQVRISAPVTGLWWAPRSPASPCPCRSLS